MNPFALSCRATAQTSRTRFGGQVQAVRLLVDLRALPPTMSRTSPATYGPWALAAVDILHVGPGELLGAQEVFALGLGLPAEDQLLAVEEDQVDAPRGVQVAQVIGDLHQQGDARGAVVGAEEGELAAGQDPSPRRDGAGCRNGRR